MYVCTRCLQASFISTDMHVVVAAEFSTYYIIYNYSAYNSTCAEVSICTACWWEGFRSDLLVKAQRDARNFSNKSQEVLVNSTRKKWHTSQLEQKI